MKFIIYLSIKLKKKKAIVNRGSANKKPLELVEML